MSAEKLDSDLNNIWLNTEETCRLLGIKRATLRRYCAENKLTNKRIKKGRKYEFHIALHSLSKDSQEKYLYENNLLNNSSEDPFYLYNKAPNFAKEKADKYMMLLTYSKGLIGQDLKDFIDFWNKENPKSKTSYPRIMQARTDYKNNGIAGLLGNYGKSKGRSKIKTSWLDYFKSIYLTEGNTTAYTAWLYTLGYAIEQDGIRKEDFPHQTSFIRKLRTEVPEQSIYLARNGEAKWNRKYANYIERDYSDIIAGSCWVSDHAQLDVMVVLEDGKLCCPWITAWVDFKTNKWLGWLLHSEAPNSDHIFQSFYYAANKYGIPTDIYLDNGKDYRSKDFAGGRKGNDASAMITKLEIMPHFALPYNAQTKPIERAFLKNKELLSKQLKGYRGGNVIERPEKLKKEIKDGELLSFKELKQIFDDFIVNVINKMPSKSKKLKGMSPDQLFNEEFKEKRTVSSEALKMFCMRTSNTVTIKRNGVRDSELQVNYWGEWMSAHKGTKVYIRRDINDYGTAYIFDATRDELLGEATICDIAPALIKGGIGKDELQKISKIKRQDKQIAKEFAKTKDISVQDKYRHLKLGAKELSPEFEESNPKVAKITDTHMDREIRKHKNNKKRDTFNISEYVPLMERNKKIYLFESDKETDERERNLAESEAKRNSFNASISREYRLMELGI